ncbi:MAG: hypothetical protein Q4F65_07605, partial [Propionibacteriaceae bacterium]|nr:hypothetical protein [Propionibacteriaceae bacterium]
GRVGRRGALLARGGTLSADAVIARALAAQPRCGDVVVVALDGPSGAGKTTLADAVAADLDCPIVRVEDLYPGWDGLAEGVRLLVDLVLEPLAAGEVARYRAWDWHAGDWGPQRRVDPVPLLVVEGCGASVGRAGEFAAVRVWVDAPTDLRRQRGLARDGETYAPWWEQWAAQERALFTADRTREKADLVVSTDLS